MRGKQAATVIICVAMVLAAYFAWYKATGSFNPNPTAVTLDTSSSCSPSAPPCPAFMIDSANLTVREMEDITSQELILEISAVGPSQVSRFSVFFSNRPIGNLTRVVLPGQVTTGGWAIPTTLNITQGEVYTVSVEGEYLDAVSGQVLAEYWSSVQVVAT